MFLKAVKVNSFAKSVKKYGEPPFAKGQYRSHYREVVTKENKNKDQVYYIVGVSSLKEGYTEYIGEEEGFAFNQCKSHKVYLVAKSIGRRYKVLPDDLEVLEK